VVTRRYTYGTERLTMTATGSTSYYHGDSLRSVATLTSSSGSTEWEYEYGPFGETRQEVSSGGAPLNSYKFVGEFEDASMLYHLRAREYDPALGRFLTLDPAERVPEASAISGYAYSDDQPTVLVDPSGRTAVPIGTARNYANIASSPSRITEIDPGERDIFDSVVGDVVIPAFDVKGRPLPPINVFVQARASMNGRQMRIRYVSSSTAKLTSLKWTCTPSCGSGGAIHLKKPILLNLDRFPSRGEFDVRLTARYRSEDSVKPGALFVKFRTVICSPTAGAPTCWFDSD
jgi:RHS repeat-associated protein